MSVLFTRTVSFMDHHLLKPPIPFTVRFHHLSLGVGHIAAMASDLVVRPLLSLGFLLLMVQIVFQMSSLRRPDLASLLEQHLLSLSVTHPPWLCPLLSSV